MTAPWPTIDTVLLDMDGTLLDLSFDDYLWNEHLPRIYARANELSDARARSLLEQRLGALRGTLQWYCMDHWTRELGVDVAALERELADRITQRPDAESFLQALNDAGKRCYLTTNAHPASMTLKMERTGLARYFDDIVSSHQHGAAKEDVKFWVSVRARLGFAPERSLLIDDNLQVLRAARRFGIGVLYGVHRPSSRAAPVGTEEFPALHSFRDIWPH